MANRFKVGDRVVIVKATRSGSDSSSMGYVASMSSFYGKGATIVHVGSNKGYKLVVDGVTPMAMPTYWWGVEQLRPASSCKTRFRRLCSTSGFV
jgi:hypothetical protein